MSPLQHLAPISETSLVQIGGRLPHHLQTWASSVTDNRSVSERTCPGRTDQAIMVETLRLNDIEQSEALFANLYAVMVATPRGAPLRRGGI